MKIKSIWSDPVWSKVIASTIIATIGLALTYFLNWWPAIRAYSTFIWHFLMSSSQLPNWLICIGAVLGATVILVVTLVLWQLLFPQGEAQDLWRSYTNDSFFGLRWCWDFGGGGEIRNLHSLCEACHYQVHPSSVGAFSIAPAIEFRCHSCAQRVGPFQESYDELESKIRRFIQQKLRTGTWAKAVP